MIISRTPFRISFFGGGTDYPAWYREHGGAVLAATIDKYCYITCRYLPPFFDHVSQVVYSRVETVMANDQIEHSAIREALESMRIREGVKIHHDGDLPSRSGLGASSSFTVGLLHDLFALKRLMPTKKQLARAAIHMEQDVLKEDVGCQDQIVAAYGGFVRIGFKAAAGGTEFDVDPVILSSERLEEFQRHLLLFYTGVSRTTSDMGKEQLERIPQNRHALSMVQGMVDEAVSVLTGDGPLAEAGKLLHESWLLKRTLGSRVTNSQIDGIYDEARRAGAIGGKILGAGGGGFMLFFAKPEDHSPIKGRLKGLLDVPFRFENQGSQIILYDPDIHFRHPEAPRPALLEEVAGGSGQVVTASSQQEMK